MTADERDDPAAALGDIWAALDSLPRSEPSAAATATTIEMIAISAQHRSLIAGRPSPLAWLAAALLLVGGFVGGLAAGRASVLTRPMPLTPGRPFVDRERPLNDRQKPFNDRAWPPRRGPPPRGEIPAPPR
jgi:hypothetical protein